MDYRVTEKIIANGEKCIFGEYYLPETMKKSAIVIFSHGYNGRYYDFKSMSKYLAQNGIASYGFDFCGGSTNSKSSLKTTEMTIYTEISDLQAVIDEIRTWNQIDNKHLYLFGGSQGGLVSALTAEKNIDKVKGLFLLYPALCIPDNWRDNFKSPEDIPETMTFWENILGKNFFTTIRDLYVFDEIGKYNKNVMIFHGNKDEIVDIEFSRKAVKIYPNAELIEFPDEGHGFTPEGELEVAMYVLKCIREHITND